MAIGTTIRGANAPPILPAAQIKACAVPVSYFGNHFETTMELLGYAPASPAPNKKRMINKLIRPFAAPVSAVKNDHHNTTLLNIFLGPILSPMIPVGISKRA